MTQLVTGDTLPPLMGTDSDGNVVDMTASVAGNWAVIMFYRGDW
jgi:peroxiredoxin